MAGSEFDLARKEETMLKLGWAMFVVATLVVAFVLSMVATAKDPCSGERVRRGTDCSTTYWFNR